MPRRTAQKRAGGRSAMLGKRALTFVALSEEPDANGYIPVVLAWVYEAGRPYVDWLFGDEQAARRATKAWMHRPSSELYIKRVMLLTDRDSSVGGYIALSGGELPGCRMADTFAVVKAAGREDRRVVSSKLARARRLFQDVASDQYYLSRMGVAPTARGAGCGTALVREYLAAGSRQGFKRFCLDVGARNRVAIQLYRSLGFKAALPHTGGAGPALAYTRMTLDRPSELISQGRTL